MNIDNARLLVIGAGVNGSICAAGLHQAGFDVMVLARGKRYDDLLSQGIVIEDQRSHTRSVTRVPLVDHLDPADRYDYVLVVVRKNQARELLPVLARNVSPNVVFMINNPSGPDEFTAAVGKDRVMLGFVFGAGRREGSVIRALVTRRGGLRLSATPFGEVDGAITPRLTRLVAILNRAGFRAQTSRHISDWLTCHAAFLPSLALPIMRHGLDTRALVRSDADLRLMVDSMREAPDVLRAVGVALTPPALGMIRFMPRSLLTAVLRLALPTRFMEMGAVWHVSQAPDEMLQLATEVGALVERSGLPAPALRRLLALKPLAPAGEMTSGS